MERWNATWKSGSCQTDREREWGNRKKGKRRNLRKENREALLSIFIRPSQSSFKRPKNSSKETMAAQRERGKDDLRKKIKSSKKEKNEKASTSKPPPSTRFQSYTPLNTTRAQILNEIKKDYHYICTNIQRKERIHPKAGTQARGSEDSYPTVCWLALQPIIHVGTDDSELKDVMLDRPWGACQSLCRSRNRSTMMSGTWMGSSG